MPRALAVDNLTIMGSKGSGKQSKAAKAKSAATALVRTLYSCTGCACQASRGGSVDHGGPPMSEVVNKVNGPC